MEQQPGRDLGIRIQTVRESKMLTRETLAQRMGVTRRTVVDWEEGKLLPTPEQLKELAELGGVDPIALVGEASAAAPAAAPRKESIRGAVIALIVGVVMLLSGVVMMSALSGDAPAAPTVEEETALPPLPECLTLKAVDLQHWDLDEDGKKELVNPTGALTLFVQHGKAYVLAKPLAEGQTLRAQDGVFIVENEEGESRIYSRLREGAIYPAGS